MTRALVIAGILFCWLAPAAAGEIADRFLEQAAFGAGDGHVSVG